MTKQEECKHEGQTGTYCGSCGKQLEADADVSNALERTLTRVLRDNYGLEPKKKPNSGAGAGESSLAEKVFGKKKEAK